MLGVGGGDSGWGGVGWGRNGSTKSREQRSCGAYFEWDKGAGNRLIIFLYVKVVPPTPSETPTPIFPRLFQLQFYVSVSHINLITWQIKHLELEKKKHIQLEKQEIV